jgi:hypothetical protein
MEVFTLPPYSTWNPCGIHDIPDGFHPFHMEYVLAGIPAILVNPFHLESIWNVMESIIPYGISIWNPSGMVMELWNPSYSINFGH